MDTICETSDPTGTAEPTTSYERWSLVFSRIHAEVGSIPIALEVLDTYRAREALRPLPIDLPKRILAISAAAFNVPAQRLLERNRHQDVTSARYVAAWLLRRRRWAYSKIAEFLHLDHSTIMHGLRKVAANDHLLLAASKAEQRLDPEFQAAIAT